MQEQLEEMNRLEKAILFSALVTQCVVIVLGVNDLGSEPPRASGVPRSALALTMILSVSAGAHAVHPRTKVAHA
jgi:hypothetical protein